MHFNIFHLFSFSFVLIPKILFLKSCECQLNFQPIVCSQPREANQVLASYLASAAKEKDSGQKTVFSPSCQNSPATKF